MCELGRGVPGGRSLIVFAYTVKLHVSNFAVINDCELGSCYGARALWLSLDWKSEKSIGFLSSHTGMLDQILLDKEGLTRSQWWMPVFVYTVGSIPGARVVTRPLRSCVN